MNRSSSLIRADGATELVHPVPTSKQMFISLRATTKVFVTFLLLSFDFGFKFRVTGKRERERERRVRERERERERERDG